MRVEREKRSIAWGRLCFAPALIVLSVAAGYYLQPFISGNSNAINTIVTIFSILAGFLIAVITFIGDPGVRGWQQLQLDKRAVEARLRRHRLLFYLYLTTLGLALAMYLIPDKFFEVKIWLERFFVGSAVFVFLASFTLPSSLSNLQMERYDTALKNQLPNMLKPRDDRAEPR
ncbi:MAG: hypothetical protein AB7E21_05610 [Pseudodonghicola sp.]